MVEKVKIPFCKIAEACEYAGADMHALERKIPAIGRQKGKALVELTYRQLGSVSDFTHYPYYGFFVKERLSQPDMGIADFRTIRGNKPENGYWLRQQVEMCGDHVEWFHSYAMAEELGKVLLVGSCSLRTDPCIAAHKHSQKLSVAELRKKCRQSAEYFKKLREAMEDEGVLTEASGHYFGNTRARYDPADFRGFAISDDYAPLIFVNRADSPSAQVFTLMHEFGHLLLGESAVSNPGIKEDRHKVESWCNAFAAEILVPLDELVESVSSKEDIVKLAKHYHVSQFVILIRCRDKKLISPDDFNACWSECEREARNSVKRPGGGNFYATAIDSMSRRFAWAIMNSASTGKTLVRDAYTLLGLKASTYLEIQNRILGLRHA